MTIHGGNGRSSGHTNRLIQGSGLTPVSLSAVRMHLDYSLKYVTGVISATRQGFLSIWLRGSQGPTGGGSSVGNMNLFNKYVVGQHTAGVADAEHEQGANFTLDAAGWRLNLGTSAPSPMNGSYAAGLSNATWDHYLWVWDTNFASGSKRMALSKNGVQTNATLTSDVVGASDVALSVADFWLNLVVASYQTPAVFDCAQWVFDNSNTSSWLTGNGTFAANVISKFYNAGPVASNSTGSNFTPAGTQPLICHDGDKTTFGTNKGSLAAPTVVGTAQRAFPYDYMVGPGATATKPYELWTNYFNNGASFTNPWTPDNTVSNGNPIPVGATIFIIMSLTNNGSGNGASRGIVMTGTGWAKVADAFINTGTGGDLAIWKKTVGVGSSDITAAGAVWNGAPVISYTNGAGLSRISYTVSVWMGVNSVVASLTGPVQGTAALGYPTPTVTATGAGTLLYGVFGRNWAGEPSISPPTTGNLLWLPSMGASAGSFPVLGWENIAASGATGNKPWPSTGTGENSCFTWQMALA